MTALQDLPSRVRETMRFGHIAEYATLTAAGVPISTTVQYFTGEGMRSLDLATGLAYPAKAERARKNPKVGLLIEGKPDGPIVSIAGMAAVRDADLQANANRYIAESCYTMPGSPPWPLARQAVWYWTRIMIEVTPARVLWWENAAAMEDVPQRWEAPANAVYPQSDPAPSGTASEAPAWPRLPWQDLAETALARGAGGHFTVADANGFPMPIRARAIRRTGEGFAFEVPKGLPWRAGGQASLSFQGIETFIGEATARDGVIALRVDRVLPLFPMTKDLKQLWEPTPDTREKLMARLTHETKRRGQPIPILPMDRPPPSEDYKKWMERAKIKPV